MRSATGGIYAAALSGRYVLGLIFVFAAIPKVLQQTDFAGAVADYRLVPASAIGFVARFLPIVELLVGVGLLTGTRVALCAYVAAALLLCFSVAVAANLLRGRTIDCGCQGSATAGAISWWLVSTDVLLAALAAFVGRVDPAALAAIGSADKASITTPNAIACLVIALLVVIGQMLVGAQLRLWRAASRFESRGRAG